MAEEAGGRKGVEVARRAGVDEVEVAEVVN